MRHEYIGPRGDRVVDGRATVWEALCSCHWRGPVRFSMALARSDWKVHRMVSS